MIPTVDFTCPSPKFYPHRQCFDFPPLFRLRVRRVWEHLMRTRLDEILHVLAPLELCVVPGPPSS